MFEIYTEVGKCTRDTLPSVIKARHYVQDNLAKHIIGHHATSRSRVYCKTTCKALMFFHELITDDIYIIVDF